MKISLHVRESKTFLDSGFQVVDSGFQGLDSRFFVSGTWDFGLLELYFGFQSPGTPYSTGKNFRDSRIRIP